MCAGFAGTTATDGDSVCALEGREGVPLRQALTQASGGGACWQQAGPVFLACGEREGRPALFPGLSGLSGARGQCPRSSCTLLPFSVVLFCVCVCGGAC